MTVPPNGQTWRLDQVERRLAHIEEHGTRGVALVQKDVDYLKQEVADLHREMKADLNRLRESMNNRFDRQDEGARWRNRALIGAVLSFAVGFAILGLSILAQ